MSGNAMWTFMVYMAADADLNTEAAKNDLLEMSQVGSTNDVNVIVELDKEKNEGPTHRYLLKKSRDGAKFEDIGDIVDNLKEVNSGDPKSLVDFIKWSANNYPAERYALILWGHGLGWNEWGQEKKDSDSRLGSLRAPSGVSDESTLPSPQSYKTPPQQYRALFNTAVEKRLATYPPGLEWICNDKTSMHSIDLKELSWALSKASNDLGKKIDLLGMDACYMSTIEVAYELRPFASYMVASEEEIPAFLGWPYDEVLKRLAGQPDLSTPDLAEHIVRSYTDRCKSNNRMDVINAAFDLSMADEVVTRLDDMAGTLIDHMPNTVAELGSAQDKSKKFKDQWDIHAFSKELQDTTSDDEVKRSAKDVCSILNPGQGKFVIAQSHLLPNYDQCCGASIYLLHSGKEASPVYASLEFAKNTRWLPMLQEYHRYAVHRQGI